MFWYGSGVTDEKGKVELGGLELQPPHAEAEPHVAEQMTAAVAAAKKLIASGAIGDPKQVFHVSLSGHAHPDHVWEHPTDENGEPLDLDQHERMKDQIGITIVQVA